MARSKGFDLSGNAMVYVYGFLGVVLLLLFAAELLPVVMNASNQVGSIPDLPLAGLFGGGIIVMIVVVVVVVGVIKQAGKVNK